MNIVQRMLTAAAVVIFGTVLYACGSSSTSATASLSQADFDKLLAASSTITAIQSGLTTVQDSADKLTGQMSRIGLFGHVGKSGSSSNSHTALSVTPDFGPCTDMGVLQGRSGGFNAMLGAIQSYQTCTGYEYSVSANDGKVQGLPGLVWTGAGCTGTVYAEVGFINKQLAANGTVIRDIATGDIVMISPDQQELTRTVASTEDASGACSDFGVPGPDTVYSLSPNDPQVTGVSNTDIPIPFSNGAP